MICRPDGLALGVVPEVWTDGLSAVEVSHQLWANLKTIAVASGAIDLVSDELADRLIAV